MGKLNSLSMLVSKSLFCIFLSSLSLSCSSAPKVYPRHELVEQILKPRPGYKGLTNRVCSSVNDKKECVYTVTDYDLFDVNFRKNANTFNFTCNIGGKRYKVCQDKPGFCHFTYKGLWPFRKKIEDYLPITNYDFLLSAKTVCANEKLYDLFIGQ